jgi:general secretion pathway protein J
MKNLPHPKHNLGFTLLEILIALAIFAILATMTSSVMFYSFNTRAKLNAHADRLNALQLAIIIIQRDVEQARDRAVRGNEMRLFPNFTGSNNYLELTRDGIVNPQGLEKRSTLKRIAILCENGQLIRRSWISLDSVDRRQYEDKILLSDLTGCSFNYLNTNLQTLSEWRPGAIRADKTEETFPKAIQMDITLSDWGNMNLFFIIPEGLYA